MNVSLKKQFVVHKLIVYKLRVAQNFAEKRPSEMPAEPGSSEDEAKFLRKIKIYYNDIK